MARRRSHHRQPGTTASQLPPPALSGQARLQRQPTPAWLEQLPAADAHDGVEAACHGGAADHHRGQSPIKTAALEPATEDRQLRHQRRHNVLCFCREARSARQARRAVRRQEAPVMPHATTRALAVRRSNRGFGVSGSTLRIDRPPPRAWVSPRGRHEAGLHSLAVRRVDRG